ncbi:MAG: DUF3794 domain-containing protein [Clostridia bacterium]|nr:DUF3794 domain-containing protein [Clostridia bacterium]
MSAETINETVKVCKYLGAERKVKTVEGDVVLPDIKPDILSVVRMKGRVCINSVKAEDNKVNIDGTISFNVVYIADDEMNSQRGVNYELNFNEAINFSGVTPNSIIRLKYDVGNIEYKVMNGRKIDIKVPVVFHVKAFNNCDISIVRGITDDDDMEVQKINCNVCSEVTMGNAQIELKENVQLNDNNSPIGEILDCDLSIVNKEYKISYNKILAKADAIVKIVYTADNENQDVEFFETSLPLMGIIDMDGVNDTQKIKLDYMLKSFWVKPVYQDLQANCISIEILADVNAFVYEKNDIELITDFYTPNATLNVKTENNLVLKNMIDEEANIQISQTLVVPELSNTKILNMSGDVNINERNVLNGKIAITGNINVYVLFSKASNHLIESKKLELPFQQVIKIDDITQNMEPLLHLEIENIDYSLAGENQLQVTINLTASILADEEDNINSISKLEISNDSIPSMPSMIIYYVKPGDTLWNIAKRFRNKVSHIMEFNELKDDTIYPGQRLLIPKLSVTSTNTSIM